MNNEEVYFLVTRVICYSDISVISAYRHIGKNLISARLYSRSILALTIGAMVSNTLLIHVVTITYHHTIKTVGEYIWVHESRIKRTILGDIVLIAVVREKEPRRSRDFFVRSSDAGDHLSCTRIYKWSVLYYTLWVMYTFSQLHAHLGNLINLTI